MSIPAEDCVGRDDGGDLVQDLAAESFALGSESTALVIGQLQSSATQLLLENSVLLDEVVDDLGLVSVHPAGERREE